MKTNYSLIEDKYKNLKVTDKATIMQLYESVPTEEFKAVLKAPVRQLQQEVKALRNLPGYYGTLMFDSTTAANLTPQRFSVLLILLSRVSYLAGKLKYSVVSVSAEELRRILFELRVIEYIMSMMLKDRHTDEDLIESNKGLGYKYYTDKESRKCHVMDREYEANPIAVLTNKSPLDDLVD